MNVSLRKTSVTGLAGLVLALAATAVMAHPGHIGHEHEGMFMSGFLHPLTGLDHLLAMLAVGLWSALTHQTMRQAIMTPLAFLVLLLVGAVAGIAGVQLPAVEPMIMASLLVLGLLVASRKTVSNVTGFVIVGVFALFHGLAHGMELPASEGAMAFVAGFMLTTFALHVTGLLAGFQLKQYNAWFSRFLGAAIAAYGALLFVGG